MQPLLRGAAMPTGAENAAQQILLLFTCRTMIDKQLLRHTWQHYKAPIAALAASTLLSIALIALRVHYTNTIIFAFLVWNLFLAWIPFVASFALRTVQGKGMRSALLYGSIFFVWFVFFPNAPYILTDFIHLRSRPPVPLWYDTVLLSVAAWNGLLLGFISLHQVQESVQQRMGARMGWFVVGVVTVASSFGIYLGRFQRWNSWDVLTDSHALFADITTTLFNPQAHPHAVGITVVFSAFLFTAYAALRWWQHADLQHNRRKV